MNAVQRILISTAATASCALAADTTPLDRYLDGLKSLRAQFSQTLVDSHERVVDRSSGTLLVLRPGRFRWEVWPQSAKGVKAGNAQLLVADGRNVWFYDRELEQVTVKPENAALSSTPAMLLSGVGGDVRRNFALSEAPPRDGLQWVLVEPKTADSDFQRALMGFSQGQLKRMIIDDRLGQTATVAFDTIARNGAVQEGEVSFTPPQGVDVIGAPAP